MNISIDNVTMEKKRENKNEINIIDIFIKLTCEHPKNE